MGPERMQQIRFSNIPEMDRIPFPKGSDPCSPVPVVTFLGREPLPCKRAKISTLSLVKGIGILGIVAKTLDQPFSYDQLQSSQKCRGRDVISMLCLKIQAHLDLFGLIVSPWLSVWTTYNMSFFNLESREGHASSDNWNLSFFLIKSYCLFQVNFLYDYHCFPSIPILHKC